MSTLQYVLIAVGVLIALSSYGMDIVNFLKGFFNRVTPVSPDVVIVPDVIVSPDTPSIPTSRKERVDTFAKIVTKWENFVNILIQHGMEDCASDMKELLVKMAKEYRVDLEKPELLVKPKNKVVKSDISSIMVN
jgi:hypothetical protein